MKDIRSRLADALQAATDRNHGCRCSACANDAADALLSLPGIAIVDAEALTAQLMQKAANNAAVADSARVNDYGQLYQLGKAEAYRDAAALLAAAVQAQED